MKKRYALLLANSEYREMKFSHLPIPGGDWEDFAHWLREPQGGGFQGVEVVTGATMPQSMLAIERFFNNKGPDDTLMVWFGGHAIIDAHGETFLCLRDSDRLRLKSTAIMAGVLAMHMDTASTQDKLLILDCRFHTFLANTQDKETRPVFRPERAFVGRGNNKHILISDPELHVHTFVEAESAARPARPFTRVLTSIWQELNDELQGLSISELYPSLCRRLGMQAKPEWYRIGEAQDLVLAPAARTEMVSTMSSNDGAKRENPDLDGLDWERLSGEFPLDILGLGLGHSDRILPPLPPSEPSPSSGGSAEFNLDPGALEPPGQPGQPLEHTDLNEEPEPERSQEPSASLESEASESLIQPSEPHSKPDPRPNSESNKFLPPDDFLGSATMSMPSPEAMEIMDETVIQPKFEDKPTKIPLTSNQFTFSDRTVEIPRQEIPELLGMVTQISNWSFDPDEKPPESQPLSTSSEKPNESLADKIKREMEAEAEREKAEQLKQEEEIRNQAEALKRWKESVKAQAKPKPPSQIQPSAPMVEPPPTPSVLPTIPPVSHWIPPEVQQTQMIDAESAEELREAAERAENQSRPLLKTNLPVGFQSSNPPAQTGNDHFAATRMYVAENPADENELPIGLEPPRQQNVIQPEAQFHPFVPQAAIPKGHSTSFSVPSPSLDTTSEFLKRFTSESPLGPDLRANQGSTLERPPVDFQEFDKNSLGLKQPGLPWVKLALIALSMLLPLVVAGFLLMHSGLFDRLSSGSKSHSNSVSYVSPAEESTPDGEILEPNLIAPPSPREPASESVKPTPKASYRPPVQTGSALTAEDAKAIASSTLPTPVHVPNRSLSPTRPAKVVHQEPEEDVESNRNLKVSLQKVVERESNALQGIYDRYVAAYPELKGVVNIRLEIGADGRVRKSACVLSTTELASFDRDITRSALRWKLLDYKGTKSKIVTLPLRFPLNRN